jgi:Protein of unknown function (DUF4236)
MGMSFKVAPGVRIRASSRGISAGVGPRAARVHVGTRGVGVSSGVGPFSAYSKVGGTSRVTKTAPTRRASYGGPTKASIAAREREVKAAAREADIDQVEAAETALVSVHKATFPIAERTVLPPIEEVDPDPIRADLEEAAGIAGLAEATGGGTDPPRAPDPEPVDRYELMREHRKRLRAGIPPWRLRERIAAARSADVEAEEEAAAETERRSAARVEDQARLDRLWQDLVKARQTVAEQLEVNVAAEKSRRVEARRAEQEQLDDEWRRLNDNDPELTLQALELAFADNDAPAAAIDCEGRRTTVVMHLVSPEAIVPERKPARTPTGKRTLKKRTKTETNELYLEALGSNVLATVKEAFAVAPGTESVQMVVTRIDTDKDGRDRLVAVYVGEFDRATFAGASGSRKPRSSLSIAADAVLNLKGKTEAVSPIELKGRDDLAAVLAQIEDGLNS